MSLKCDSSILEASESVISEDFALDDYDQCRWYALYTRSRHEKFVEKELNKKSIETFLPIRRVERRWSDRKKTIEQPVFGSYLFVNIPLSERLNVLNTTGSVSLLGGTRATPSAISQKEIETIKKFIQEDIPVNPFPYLKEGKRVYIRSGALKGAEGFIVRKGGHCRLVVSLDLLMQSISVEVDQAQVELI